MMTYNRRLDRWIDLRGGLAGKSMHDYVLREIEIGARASSVEDSERCGWSALDDIAFGQYLLSRPGDRVV